jgi:O-6-methylguanine DNA methyltransferase
MADGAIRWLSLGPPDEAAVQAYWNGPVRWDSPCPLSDDTLQRAALGKRPLHLAPLGTAFQQKVWSALSKIPARHTCTYRDLGAEVAGPTHARAVGQAVGANPIAWLIPCHRVVPASGKTGQYRWGSHVKEKLLRWETGQPSTADPPVPDFKDMLLRAERFHQQAKSTAEIAHDLNNLLTPIRIAAELLNQRNQDAALNRYVEVIRFSAENARRLIDDILQLARHQEPVAQHPLNVEPLLREILSTLQPTFPERIHLTLSCASPLPSVQIDPSQFQRAIVNLLLNARDAIEGEGTIAIEAAAHDLNTAVDGLERTLFPGRYLAITITDSGAGISPEIMERVFEPFFTTKAAGQGSGIGLSSAYGIIVRAGGFMRLTSEPGKGSEFQIFLPVPPSAMA